MRIAFDHSIFTHQRFGGISRYFVELVPRLAELGESPLVFAGLHQNAHLSSLRTGVVRGKFVPGIPRRLLRLRSWGNETYLKRLLRNWKPDLIHHTYFRDPIIGTGPIPTVVTVYDMIHELFPADFPNHAAECAAKRRSVDAAEHIICISNSTRNDLIRLLEVDPAKVSVVHLGIEETSGNFQSVDSPERPYFLFVGHRIGYKNFEKVLEAMSFSGLLKDFDLVAFGGSTFSAAEFERMHALGFKPDQVRHTAGSDDVLADLYRNAWALVYPSLYEGFGLPPLEAMAQSCPVISSNTSSMPEVIGDAAEFFDPTNVEDMARALSCIATQDSRRSYLIAQGLLRIKSFSWEKTALETRDIYRKILR